MDRWDNSRVVHAHSWNKKTAVFVHPEGKVLRCTIGNLIVHPLFVGMKITYRLEHEMCTCTVSPITLVASQFLWFAEEVNSDDNQLEAPSSNDPLPALSITTQRDPVTSWPPEHRSLWTWTLHQVLVFQRHLKLKAVPTTVKNRKQKQDVLYLTDHTWFGVPTVLGRSQGNVVRGVVQEMILSPCFLAVRVEFIESGKKKWTTVSPLTLLVWQVLWHLQEIGSDDETSRQHMPCLKPFPSLDFVLDDFLATREDPTFHVGAAKWWQDQMLPFQQKLDSLLSPMNGPATDVFAPMDVMNGPAPPMDAMNGPASNVEQVRM